VPTLVNFVYPQLGGVLAPEGNAAAIFRAVGLRPSKGHHELLGNPFAPEPGRMVEKNIAAASRKRGRPRGGVRPGERMRDYPVLTVRVPPDTRAMFTALCTRRRVPRWLMLRHLIVCFVRNLPANERRRIVQRRKAA
jgi:hypothetical protein